MYLFWLGVHNKYLPNGLLPKHIQADLVRDLLTKKTACNHIVKCEGWPLKGQSPPLLSLPSLVGLTLKTHLRANPTVLVVKSFSICCSFSRILTFAFSIQNLQGFILIWRISFWHELLFWIANQLGHCECIIGMHTLIHVRNVFLISEFSNPTFHCTCLFHMSSI
jgi:hypothetical protein